MNQHLTAYEPALGVACFSVAIVRQNHFSLLMSCADVRGSDVERTQITFRPDPGPPEAL